MYVPGAHELKQPRAPVCTTEAALLYPTPGRRRDTVGVKNFIHHHRSRIDELGQTSAASYIAGPDAGGQTINAIVRQSNCFFICLESHDGQHRAERFVAHHIHVVVHID